MPDHAFEVAKRLVILGGSPISLQLAVHLPGSQAGLDQYLLSVPPNPTLVGLSLHFQEVGLTFNNLLTVSEATTITLTN